VRPFGTWPSDISATMVAKETRAFSDLTIDGKGTVWWAETFPEQAGRTGVFRCHPQGEPVELTDPSWDVRSRVHEYGGAAWGLCGEGFIFSEYEDGRLYLVPQVGADRVPLTPDQPDDRYADIAVLPDMLGVVAVRERHGEGLVNRQLVRISLDQFQRDPEVLFAGSDFVSSPRISPDGAEIAFITWDHPAMPWDRSQLRRMMLTDRSLISVAGERDESLIQPEWAAGGNLYVLSDRTGWWNLYRCDPTGLVPVRLEASEFGEPPWVLGMRTYSLLGTAHAVVRYGTPPCNLGILDLKTGKLDDIELPFVELHTSLDTRDQTIAFIGETPDGISQITVQDRCTGERRTIASTRGSLTAPALTSRSHRVRIPRRDGSGSVPVQLYGPASAQHEGPPGKRPPWIIFVHGGPTWRRAATPLEIAYFTSRGFGVADVDYAGSSGWGRQWRQSLYGRWGVLDADDCLDAARWLVDAGEADQSMLAIRGGSAGGWTALCAIARDTVFRGAVSLCGVVDAAKLVTETHDFESHYLDALIGPLPFAQEVYDQRSPLNNVHRIRTPVLILQGLDDPIVPATQSRALIEALKTHNVPHTYVAFEGERHGLRDAGNRAAALEAELAFYRRIFGVDTPPVDDGGTRTWVP